MCVRRKGRRRRELKFVFCSKSQKLIFKIDKSGNNWNISIKLQKRNNYIHFTLQNYQGERVRR